VTAMPVTEMPVTAMPVTGRIGRRETAESGF
jgi:hypothetical protein